MPGSGACDITGVIPYQAVPQSYDPPSHLIAADNQRPVSGDYPYYVGTALDDFDPGYRAARAYAALRAAEPLTAASIARLQADLTDPLAARVLPAVLRALSGPGQASPVPSGTDASALALLRSWNGTMTVGSAAAALWWTFWGSYLNTVFAAAAGAVAGWALALWIMALSSLPVGATARAIAALAGLPPYAAVTVAVTLLVAALQALTGAWLGRTAFPRRAPS
jgi:acyl-homoserine lactone acylase PvdQ